MPLNPFIRAFFRSTIPSQCSPIQDYILLVPNTDILLHSRDRETNQPYTDLVHLEEFLASHVIRAPKDDLTNGTNNVVAARENRGKARQYSTSNGRTVIVKDTWVYTNKGFRTLNQAQLQSDVLYWPNSVDSQPWLIYYITRPLIGTLEPIPLTIRYKPETVATAETSAASLPKKRPIKSFDELLGLFPMIARQLQPGLRALFHELEMSIPETSLSALASPAVEVPQPQFSGTAVLSNGLANVRGGVDEETMRTTTETAIMAAIELFQRVDQSQLQLLATTTDLTGSSIEHLIERYVCEQLHDAYIFPRLFTLKKIEDLALDQKIKEMEYIDIAQVGLALPDNKTREKVATKVVQGIEKFEKLSEAKSPQEMLDVLLETAQTLTIAGDEENQIPRDKTTDTEKSDDLTANPVLTMNADMLVSLLLIVVIRAKVHGLQTCLSYMRNFIFLDDVEQGEKGYVLSTLEAVLFHITLDSEHMGKASKRNGRLWDRIRKGNVMAVRSMFEKKTEELDVEISSILSPMEESGDVRFVDFDPVHDLQYRKAHGRQKHKEKNKVLESLDDKIPVEAEGIEEDGIKGEEPVLNGILLSPNLDAPATASLPEILRRVEPREKVPELIPELELPENVDEVDEVEKAVEKPPPDMKTKVQDRLSFDKVNRSFDLNAETHEEEEEREDTFVPLPVVGAICNLIDKQEIPNYEGEETFHTDTETQVDEESTALMEDTVSTLTERTMIAEEGGQGDRDLIKPKIAMKAKFNPDVFFEGGTSARPKRHKMNRSISMRSEGSRNSWASSYQSLDYLSHNATSLNEDLTSIDILAATQNVRGESVVMMAIHNQQKDMIEYLTEESTFYPLTSLLQDKSNDGTNLLSAAMQGESYDIVRVIMEEILKAPTTDILAYMRSTDKDGRTSGHYAFNHPQFVRHYGHLITWSARDKNLQTPLFAMRRSYDHPNYKELVILAIRAAEAAQLDGDRLHLDEHVDRKGNTLLHIIHDQQVLKMLLKRDADVNAVNEKGLSPLMLASKYGRVENVRTLFADRRVDIFSREARGLTAVELAKDDEVRNKFDDMVMFSYPTQEDGRITAVVRGIFVEDATVRLVVKSGMPSSEMKYTITTCRRLLTDFEFLAYWLSFEHPASWIPALHVTRTPFQIPSKPSRAVLRDIQSQLDSFLRTLLAHSTFSTHELLWEFFLMPDMQPEAMIERSKRKCEIRTETVQEDYEPVDDVKDIEVFMSHAKETIRTISIHTRSVLRRTNNLLRASYDLSDAVKETNKRLDACTWMEGSEHIKALQKYALAICPNDSSPMAHFMDEFRSIAASLAGLTTALERPRRIIGEMGLLQKEIDKHMVSLRRSDRWPLGLMDETRAKIHRTAEEGIKGSKGRQEALSRELRYSQGVAAQELAGFHEMHGKFAKEAIRRLVRNQTMVEREKLEALKRTLRVLRKD